ncbi:MAG TPA: hypothetical protein VGK89_09810 [Candidatus Eisenbacteria bacterium]|jgi:hypothetical protein
MGEYVGFVKALEGIGAVLLGAVFLLGIGFILFDRGRDRAGGSATPHGHLPGT